MQRNDNLDGMRGIAVLIVFLYHTLGKPAAGNLGVDVFFVLSGYLITSKLIEEIDATGTVDIFRFYLNRCLRLLPAFFVMCVLYEGLHYCFPGIVSSARPISLLAFLFTSNIYWMNGLQPFPVASHTWTLATEWQFYLVWPFIAAFVMRRREHRLPVALLLAACALALVIAELHEAKVPKYEGILIGSSMAIMLSVARRENLPLRGAPLALASTIGIVAWSFIGSKFGEKSSLVAVALSVGAIYAMTNSGSEKAIPLLSGHVLKYFGKISYGLYIYHFPIVAVAYVAGMSPVRMFIIGVAVTIPLADFSFRFIEAPALKLRSVFHRTKHSTSAAAAR
ncbi:acyltransferase family protein [Paraburkholderia sp. 1N]|uniref:Acyltransferase family protein n=1 Tax=Paraburkholderia solitsugae TaxID=2675748 RepID=A0ABX2BN53_9BURK|nr:acyltransferase [Paraburkholderia solitsugae]NPT42365.1 acyltransferase family protein [Paraburkholderia solitsugae]